MRFRRRISILPGLHLNLSKSGVSASIGPRGLTVNKKIISPGYSENKIAKSEDETDKAFHIGKFTLLLIAISLVYLPVFTAFIIFCAVAYKITDYMWPVCANCRKQIWHKSNRLCPRCNLKWNKKVETETKSEVNL